MKGVSMLAFNNFDELDDFVCDLNPDYIEIVPSMLSSFFTNDKDGYNYFYKNNIKLISAQSLLFGVDCSIFESNSKMIFILKLISECIDRLSILGIEKFVFGSPKNRSIGINCYSQDIEFEFFTGLDKICLSRNVTLCIEPVPEQYGCDYLNTLASISDIIKKYNLKSIGANLDIGNFICSNENLNDLYKYTNIIWHSHCSTFGLGDVLYDNRHMQFFDFIKSHEIDVTLEILSSKCTNLKQNWLNLNYVYNT